METVLQEVGLCGRFQIIHLILMQLTRFAMAWVRNLMVFGLYDPGWRCVKRNFTEGDMQFQGMIPSQTSSNQSSHIGMLSLLHNRGEKIQDLKNINYTPVKMFINDTITTKSNNFNDTCDGIDSCSAIEFDSISSTVVSEFGLVCDKVWIGYLIVSIYNAGMLLGSIVWGYVGERFGRRIALYGGTFLMMVCSGLGVSSPNWEIYAFVTFFIGFGNSGVQVIYSVFCMEYLTSKWRGRVGALPVWNVGVICFAVASSILKDWKHIHLATTFVCGIACLGFFQTQESLRWLMVHGKESRAEKVVYKIAKINKRVVRGDILEELAGIGNKMESDGGYTYTYFDLFRYPEIRVPVLLLCLIWVIDMFVYDIISFGIQALPGDFYTNMIVSNAYGLPIIFIGGPLSNRIGRRLTGILQSLIGAVCCTVILILLLAMVEGTTRDTLVSTLAFVTQAVMQGIFNYFVAYATELIPTAVRSLAFGFFNISSRVTIMVGIFILPRDSPSMIAYFCVIIVVLIVMTVSFWSLPETNNRPLKDTIGEMKEDRHANCKATH